MDQSQNNNTIALLKQHLALSQFVVFILLVLSLNNFLGEIIDNNFIDSNHHTHAMAIRLLCYFLPVLIYLKKSRLPLRLFGFRLGNLKADFKETIIWSCAFCFLILIFKLFLLHYTSLLSSSSLWTTKRDIYWLHSLIAYNLLSFMQALGQNGFIQSSLMHLTKVSHAILISVVVSALVYASVHVDLNFVFAIATLPACLFWGALYARQQSLIGVTLSHAIIGTWALWLLGFGNVFQDIEHYFR